VIDGTTIIPDMQKIYPNVAFVDSTKWQAINSNVADQLKQLINMFFSKADEIAKQRASNGTDTKFGSLKNKEIPAD
jgi:endo-1,4-beta-mannosidase